MCKSGPTRRLLPAGLAVLLGLGGCAAMDIEQGSYLTRGQVAKMEQGMSRSEVRRALGEPLLQDPFHPRRWDYVFMRISEDGERTYRRLSVFFDGQGRVARTEKAGSDFPEGYVPSSGAS
ncbi:outer membrane protein assembly factor BamE [Thiohalorhabdus methylotrophus]|uniref:Outer membrane protein assembly factor BamE n=1 Tax=Thiohalorhabdus methylotrophus TaxID=3242694 RepID=A0ABV4TXI9_9GAMM